MNKLKLLKWGAGLLIPLVIGLIGGCNIKQAQVAKKFKEYEKVKFDTNSELTAKSNIIKGLRLDVSEFKLKIKNNNEEIIYLKENPIIKIKRVPVTKYKTIEKIKYVKADRYELTFNAFVKCQKQYNQLMKLRDEADRMWSNLVQAQKNIIDTYEGKEKIYTKRIKAADSTIDWLKDRYYSTLYFSLTVSSEGFISVDHNMVARYGWEFVRVSLGFRKDVFKVALN